MIDVPVGTAIKIGIIAASKWDIDIKSCKVKVVDKRDPVLVQIPTNASFVEENEVSSFVAYDTITFQPYSDTHFRIDEVEGLLGYSAKTNTLAVCLGR